MKRTKQGHVIESSTEDTPKGRLSPSRWGSITQKQASVSKNVSRRLSLREVFASVVFCSCKRYKILVDK